MNNLNLPAFFINRDVDSHRRQLIETELSAAGIGARRSAGVDGYATPEALVPYYDGTLSAGETGCSASHLVVARTILAERLPFALVLEDDARLCAGFLEMIKLALPRLPRNWDIVRLCRRSRKAADTVAQLSGGRQLVRYIRMPYGTAGLLVSASGAQKLLTPRLIKEPIDVEISRPWRLGLNVFGIDPPIVEEVDRGVLPSTIEHRTRSSKSSNLARMAFNISNVGLLRYLRCEFQRVPSRD